METIELVFTFGVQLLVIYFLYQSKKELVQINGIFKQLARDNQRIICFYMAVVAIAFPVLMLFSRTTME
jgi:hypothetical protein